MSPKPRENTPWWAFVIAPPILFALCVGFLVYNVITRQKPPVLHTLIV